MIPLHHATPAAINGAVPFLFWRTPKALLVHLGCPRRDSHKREYWAVERSAEEWTRSGQPRKARRPVRTTSEGAGKELDSLGRYPCGVGPFVFVLSS